MEEFKFDMEPQNPQEIDIDEMRESVKLKSKFKLTDEQFDAIEAVFREKWNRSTGEFVGDGDFKKYVYETMRNRNFVMLEMVEDVVDLIIEYMEEKGQYHNYHRDN